ncbi:sensor histidine kinase [Paenibacillus sp. HJL G12]|uniref:Circadian input-output histidine kinase CikA n=1 Tax=Paenibacillus dendrobii TaxID=2691084 RepID=A0A7X3LJU1_9BACL|nr:ATP-binding protein [Paenibacillus dendrobii]MWV45754.1 sensor histidine kinase [Paenibacillus dendrobii]
MEFSKIFLGNTALLVTVAYLANLIYKYALSRTSSSVKYVSSVLLIIFCGWLSMFFGYNVSENVIFDLRIIPLIIATVSYAEPLTLVIIGASIGISRLLFGINEASIAGCLNLCILGVAAALLHVWMNRRSFGLITQGLITIIVINLLNCLDIAFLGVISAKTYFMEIMPIALPLSLVLSLIFSLILRDFQLEGNRMVQIKHSNVLLSAQAEELHKAKIVLEERARELALSSQYKTEFLANMSHELRTPLNSIINFAQLISEPDEGRTKEEIAEYGEIIYQSGQELLTIINDILDLTKVEAGQLEIVNEDMNISEIPQLVAMHFEHAAERGNISFEIQLDERLPQTMYTDPNRVQQILRNLLSNAFKFTHDGQVKLNIRLERLGSTDQKEDWIVFDVIDSGIGIPKEKQAHIFEAFKQADGSISRKYGGTGLGLSISRDLSRLLSGYIEMESEEGKGSRFSLHLPLIGSEAFYLHNS